MIDARLTAAQTSVDTPAPEQLTLPFGSTDVERTSELTGPAAAWAALGVLRGDVDPSAPAAASQRVATLALNVASASGRLGRRT